MLTLSPLIALIVVLVMVWGFWPGRFEKPDDDHHCQHCGYDLRAGHDRCPECGAAVPSSDVEDASEFYLSDLFLTAPLERRAPEKHEAPQCAYTTNSPLEAAFIVQLLDNHGIAAFTEGQPRPTDYQPVKLRVMTWSGDLEAAVELLGKMQQRLGERRADEAQA